ncbi:glycosyltransferase family 2 protein, partial [Mycobacterium sp. NAZ190054]|uniref:glycosyltransferase family 2 protein n=1 Tax=Mycobacterium sp. NAZ190054 TaxID=1747766 RepID=UPI000B1B9AFC
MTLDATLVIPTIGRKSLSRLLSALAADDGMRPAEIIVVDDRVVSGPLSLPDGLPIQVVHSDGRGPAAARNVGWRAAATRWVCFLDDDVLPPPSITRRAASTLNSGVNDRRVRDMSTSFQQDTVPLSQVSTET